MGNLNWEVSWQDLKEHMKSTGIENVTQANVMMNPDGRSKGCGIVEYGTEQAAQQAILTLNDTELSGRQIFVREDREGRSGGGGNSASGGGYGGDISHHAHHGGAGGGIDTGESRFSAGETAQGRRVYVGNLSWDVAWQDLKDHMREVGEVVHAEVITEANGRSKGCGVVEFASENEAQQAVETLTDTNLKGRMIFVREDRESSGGAAGGFYLGNFSSSKRSSSVYVWNLAYETSWQDLKDHMRIAGNVDQATILTNSEGRSMGCGVVVYQRPQDSGRAIRELQKSDLNGRPMFVREDREQGGRSGRGGRGGRSGRGGRVVAGRRHYGGRGSDSPGRGRGSAGRGGASRGDNKEGVSGLQLFVGNLSFDTNQEDLNKCFSEYGKIQHTEVMEDPDGKKKGFGTVRFHNKDDAEHAIQQLDGTDLLGRNLTVRFDYKAN